MRVIFQLPDVFKFNEPLAYVEWFTEPVLNRDAGLGLYRVKRQFEHGHRSAYVIWLLDIRRSCRLLPDFADTSFACTANMLDTCNSFFVDNSLDEHCFCILF